MATPEELIEFVEDRKGSAICEDEGITFGPRTRAFQGVAVAWMANETTIAAAAAAGCDCIVHHEALTYPYPSFTESKERHYLSWPTNHKRLAALAKHNMTAIRLHGSLDEAYIFDAFAQRLGLGRPIDERDGYAERVFGAPVPTFSELVAHVKQCTGMVALRTTVEAVERPVHAVGLPWGGVGLFVNVAYMQSLIDLGVDTFICGETDNCAFRFAAEAGVAVIETSHEVSEAPGLEDFARDLGEMLDIPCHYIHMPCIWRVQ